MGYQDVGPYRSCLVFLTLIFMVFGVVSFGLGVWITVNDYGYISDVLKLILKDNLLTAAYVMIGVGLLVILGSFAGFYGSTSKNNGAICFFVLCSLVLFAGVLASGILASIHKKKLGSNVYENLYSSFANYQPQTDVSSENDVAKAWDYFQVLFDCCGAFDYTDYREVNFHDNTTFVPKSCCVLQSPVPENPVPVNNTECQHDAANTTTTTSAFLHTKGCSADIQAKANYYINCLIGTAFGFTFLELLVTVVACCAFCGGGGSGRKHCVCRWRCC